MLYGIVDIGSNTIRLKIYEYKNNKIKSVFSKKKTAGLIAYRDDGKLNDEGINILSSILNKFNKIMNLLNVARRYFFATASLRNISNTYEIIDFIKEKNPKISDNQIAGFISLISDGTMKKESINPNLKKENKNYPIKNQQDKNDLDYILKKYGISPQSE